MKMNIPKILIKTIGKDGRVKRVAGHKIRRICYFLKANNFSNRPILVRVNYGNGISNSGEYLTCHEALEALKAFMEVKNG